MSMRTPLLSSARCRAQSFMIMLVMPDGTCKHTQRFSAMLSHDVIGNRYDRPGEENDKGKVEGLVG